jgi:hypothetical protein
MWTERSWAGWVPCGRTCPLGFKPPTWHGYLHFHRFISWFNVAILSVVGDVPVNSEASVVTSSISWFAGPIQFFGGAHRDRVCLLVFLEVSMRSCTLSVCICNWVSKKKMCMYACFLFFCLRFDCIMNPVSI